VQIATWNVNSVRARLERVLPWLAARRPDVLCLQEIKCLDEQFPREPFEELGYSVATFGQKTYNGVAILARSRIEGVVRGLSGEDEHAQRRAIGAQIGDVLVLNLYVVNGEAVGSEKYAYKLAWLERLRAHLAAHYGPGAMSSEKIVICGDFNITFDDRDVHDPELWREKILCSTPEREALRALCALGFEDLLRKFHPEAGIHTWWDFRTRGFERGLGLRIDHVLGSPAAAAACTGVEVDLEARAGSKPSDHAPVIAHFA
jgi:exodeoxyribonuclease-3